MRMVLAVFVGLVLSLGAANATIPEPAFCTVSPGDDLGGVLMCPNSPSAPDFSIQTVNVRNGDNEPIPDAYVELVFGQPGNHCFCGTPLTGTTDEDGNVTFIMAGGGCTMDTPDAIRIIANTVEIRSYPNVKSPDFDGSTNCSVDLADFIVFGQEFIEGDGGCHDYDNNDVTDLGDFIVVGQGWAHVCE